MTNSIVKNAIGLVAAASMMLVLFSAVANLADSDRAATLAAQIKRAQLAKAGR